MIYSDVRLGVSVESHPVMAFVFPMTQKLTSGQPLVELMHQQKKECPDFKTPSNFCRKNTNFAVLLIILSPNHLQNHESMVYFEFH